MDYNFKANQNVLPTTWSKGEGSLDNTAADYQDNCSQLKTVQISEHGFRPLQTCLSLSVQLEAMTSLKDGTKTMACIQAKAIVKQLYRFTPIVNDTPGGTESPV